MKSKQIHATAVSLILVFGLAAWLGLGRAQDTAGGAAPGLVGQGLPQGGGGGLGFGWPGSCRRRGRTAAAT